jgi:murein DD-endopeptidase MepM/ murein hydrolase activator NlpD
MAEKLTGSEQAAAVYTVKDGDTATSIARQYNLTLSELNRLNNNRVGDDLKIGMQLNVQTPQTLLHVKVVKKETRTTSLPYKTVTEKDDSQYTDYSKIVTQGQEGVQEITEEVTYVNGIETSRTTLSKRVVTEAVDKKVVTGTKKRPQYSGSGESSGSLMWPVPSIRNITSYFAYRWGRMHTGIDISGGNSYGKTIVAADGGVVSYVKYSSSGYGYHLQINHGNGISTLYGHTSKILVSSGQRVSKGQPIALIGSTGDSTGAHLHFEVIKNGQKVNPLLYVSR